MGETETYQLHSFNSFITDFNHSGGVNIVTRSNAIIGDENGGKKYKLRLKFDGACALEVVRLNGGHFQNLTHLDISGNSAEKLDLRSLSRLEWLCCSNNNLEVLSLSGNSLTYLDCSRNNLQSISIDPVPNNLSNLQMSFNNLEDLPTWLWIIPDLSTVYASHNRLRQVDCKFQSSLSHLPIRELHLHCNKIEFVSKDFIQRATRLKVLNLSQNLIEQMPNFGKRSNIQELFLSRNRLQDTEDRDALDFLLECFNLRRLYLAFNKIENINDRCITAWKNLEELILCGNRIRNLPSKISTLTNLRVLRVHSNRLENAPNLTKMPALKVVDLSHNNLRKLNLDNLIAGGNLTYLDISCNERLFLNPEKLHNPKRPMNLVEVSNPRKQITSGLNNDFPPNPPWDIGFSELPDRNQVLGVTQYRDVNLGGGKEALFGIFDGGDRNTAPKTITKSISKIYDIERNIEETHQSSLNTLKYTLLNAMKNIRQQGNNRPMQGVLCHLSMTEDPLLQTRNQYTLNLAMIGGIRCLLIEAGKKVTRLTDMEETNVFGEPPPQDLVQTSVETNTDMSNNKLNSRLNGNIPDPQVLQLNLTPSAEYLIIANQSVWNFVSEKELVEELEINRHKKSVLIAKRITDMAQSHSCKQSLSLILVRFKWYVSSKLTSDTVNTKFTMMGEFGPLSYCSGSSEYSDVSNPLVSVTTPDSAIDTDRSSAGGSINGSKVSSGKSNNINKHIEENDFSNERKLTKIHVNGDDSGKDIYNEDMESLANTSISQMSVEQFRCWEYMLEQNTKLLFKKELDSLSKGVFTRNQKLRKSVHFPYHEKHHVASVKNVKNPPASSMILPHNKSGAPGFYTLSKAKSLSHLFGGDRPADSPPSMISSTTQTGPISGNYGNKSIKSPHFPLFSNGNSAFLGSVRSSSRATILGGPNAAYFGSAQRLISPPAPSQSSAKFYDADEAQDMRSYDSADHDSRLKNIHCVKIFNPFTTMEMEKVQFHALIR
ncbi:unnamed protein product [Allacma fusca]|uniref:PPM-type phosphatase domain-containing protein n=1 Tax=Allacma fusca TaxID=39272 RepID=A0A8J2KJ27_9HEXA|nr:unnamed protein product [Allacma fusca]